MNTNGPKVSVFIPTYNNAQYIGKTIRSIIEQTYDNLEIVISDNGSQDNTREVVAGFTDKRIRYVRREQTVSCTANWNQCYTLCSGEYIAIYHSDDVYEKNIVEKEVRTLSDSENIGAIFTLDRIIDEKDCELRNGVRLERQYRQELVRYNAEGLLKALLRSSANILVAPTFMAKREVFDKVGFFDESDQFGQSIGGAADTEFWIRISKQYDIGILTERLIRRRVSTTQGYSQYESKRNARANHFVVLDMCLERSGMKDRIGHEILAQYEFNKFYDDIMIAKNMIKQRKEHDAVRYLCVSLNRERIRTGLSHARNYGTMVMYLVLLLAALLNIGRKVVWLAHMLRRI